MKKIELACAWNAKELTQNPDWIYVLSNQELSELNSALSHCRNLPFQEITKQDFPLEMLQRVLKEKFLQQLEMGIGTVLIKGINSSNFSEIEMGKILWGLGLYLGTAVSQSVKGEVLHEVKDDGYQLGHPKARGTNTNCKLWFHNDTCDVAVLMCVRTAESGGESQIVSSVAIHNEMLAHYPDLLAELYQPYYFKRHNVFTTQAEPFGKHPIIAFEQGYFICNILRPLIDRAQELNEVPKMTARQIKALDVFEELCHAKKFCHEFNLDPGDIWLQNSFVTLHSRKEFVDHDEVEKKRLLLRLWLSVSNSRPLPESLKVAYKNINAGAVRGGVQPEHVN